MLGFVIDYTRDLDCKLIEKLLGNEYQNSPQWIEKNYNIVNENYKYCVAREYIKLIADCINHNIPLQINLDLKAIYNANSVNSIFEIELNNIEYTPHLWIDLFKSDIQRNIKVCTHHQAVIELLAKKQLFIKTSNKGFSRVFSLEKDFNNLDVQILETLNTSYGKHWFPWEDAGLQNATLDGLQKLKNQIGDKEYITTALQSMLHSYTSQELIISDVMAFKLKNEFRCIFVGNKIHSISERIDYHSKSKKTQKHYDIINTYCQYLAEKYYTQVPYKIWNVDICLVRNKPIIVEAHLDCSNLGHFIYNQDYKRYLDLI